MGLMDKIFGQGSPTGQPVKRLSPTEFKTTWEQEKNGVILDVRLPDEFTAGHLQQAVNLDFMSPSFNQRLADLDKDKSYYLYCVSGNRSGQAAAIMAGAGFSKIANIGGFYGLVSAGVKTE